MTIPKTLSEFGKKRSIESPIIKSMFEGGQKKETEWGTWAYDAWIDRTCTRRAYTQYDRSVSDAMIEGRVADESKSAQGSRGTELGNRPSLA